MKRTAAGALAAILGLGVVACAGDAEQQVEDGESTAVPAETAAAPAADPEVGAVLRSDSLAGGEPYLTDANGRALYLLEGEPADSSRCYDACAREWPPFLSPGGPPTAAGAVQAGLIGTIQRRDGGTQVTYGGHPLYYHHDDEGPGETQGQDVRDQWGEWYLVRPGGEALEAEPRGEAGS